MDKNRIEWSMAEQFKLAFAWEAKKLFYRLYIPAGIFLGVLLLIGLLPQAACDFLKSDAFGFVALINTGFVIAEGVGIFLPVLILIAPYGDQTRPVKVSGDLSEEASLMEGRMAMKGCPRVSLLARLALGEAVLSAMLLTGNLASVLMEKFNTESMRWFHLNFTLESCKILVYLGAVMPLAILWIFLRRLGRYQERQYIQSVFWGGLLGGLISAAAELQILHFAPGKEPPLWIMDGVWYLVMLGSAAALFRLSLRQMHNSGQPRAEEA